MTDTPTKTITWDDLVKALTTPDICIRAASSAGGYYLRASLNNETCIKLSYANSADLYCFVLAAHNQTVEVCNGLIKLNSPNVAIALYKPWCFEQEQPVKPNGAEDRSVQFAVIVNGDDITVIAQDGGVSEICMEAGNIHTMYYQNRVDRLAFDLRPSDQEMQELYDGKGYRADWKDEVTLTLPLILDAVGWMTLGSTDCPHLESAKMSEDDIKSDDEED